MSTLGTVIVLLAAATVLGTPLVEEVEEPVWVTFDLDIEHYEDAKNEYSGAQVWKVSTDTASAHAVMSNLERRKRMISSYVILRLVW